MRAWFSTCTTPSGGQQLLDQVVLLVVERRAAEVRDRHRAAVLARPSPRRGRARIRSTIMSIAVSSGSSSHAVPCGPAVLDAVLAQRPVVQALGRRALRAEAAARDRARGVAFDLCHGAVLDVDELPAADGAERADRVHDLVGRSSRGRSAFVRSDCAAFPVPSRSPSRTWRTTGHVSSRSLSPTAPHVPARAPAETPLRVSFARARQRRYRDG